ncbi:hypothetical protein [Vibrio hepatarius]|uniref:Uncharacterized protein n=1 Tax=Vibrio hepatarius TaxID=171383 RepID=A0A0M0I4B1_9VIBR|nr:hypothetical protein [Vibrio hepatarius]KOO09161.1 hypothetical protein AKJ31_02025 [Vibrio hepatarius]
MKQTTEQVTPIKSIVTRAEALESDKTFYFTGKPCKRGHVAERYTNNACCVECMKAYQANPKTKAKKAEYNKSDAGKARRLRYDRSAKGKAIRRASDARFYQKHMLDEAVVYLMRMTCRDTGISWLKLGSTTHLYHRRSVLIDGQHTIDILHSMVPVEISARQLEAELHAVLPSSLVPPTVFSGFTECYADTPTQERLMLNTLAMYEVSLSELLKAA